MSHILIMHLVITIEGEVRLEVPPDVINFQSNGAIFAPVIEVTGTPVIEWIFDDSTTSTSTSPIKDYGSSGSRRNYLKVTPWSALIGINVGYDAGDGGYGGFNLVANQNILEFDNLTLAKSSLQYFCASYNPIKELDLRGLEALKFVELFYCQSLSLIKLDSHPVLERICVEDCDLDSLDLSGCSALEDLRGALNDYTSIEWGSIGQSLWHICIRDNPKISVNIPPLTQFPLLRELLNWNTNQTGLFECHSSVIQYIDSYNNNYTSADITGCSSLGSLSLSGSQLTSLDLGTANNLTILLLENCGLTGSLVAYVLNTLDVAGLSHGYLDLSGNYEPSSDALAHVNNLTDRGWIVDMGNMTGITDSFEKTEPLRIIVNNDLIKILLTDYFVTWEAELYNMQGILVSSQIVDSDNLVFNISSLSSGVYIVVLSKGEKRRIAKVII